MSEIMMGQMHNLWVLANKVRGELNGEGLTVEQKCATGNLYDYSNIDEEIMEYVVAVNGFERGSDEFTNDYNECWGIIHHMLIGLGA